MTKTFILQVLICSALMFTCRAEDWTTRDGKTYHDVKDAGHNNEEVDITSKEGNASVMLDDLPFDLQKRYHFDAEKEQSMDQYLTRVRVAMPGPPDALRIQKYSGQLKYLLACPSVVKDLSSDQLLWLMRNRLNVGPFVPYQFALPTAEAVELPNNEIKVMGLMLTTIESRIDPAIDTTKLISWQDHSEAVQEQEKQMQIKRQVWNFVKSGQWYLKSLYRHQNDGVSVDPEARPILLAAGVDATSIDYLVGKTDPSDH